MNIKGKIKIVLLAYKKVHNKKDIIKKIIKILSQGGLTGLKYAIFGVYRRGAKVEDIYDYQQNHIPSIEEVDGSVTVIIEVPNNSVDISGTIMSLKNQSYKDFDVKLVVPTGYSGYEEYEKIHFESFPGEAYKKVMEQINSDHLYILNGGNILHPSTLMLLLQSTDGKKDVLTYCDECIFDGLNGNRLEYFIKPDYSEVYQATSMYMEQGIMFPSLLVKKIDNFMGKDSLFPSRIQSAVFDTLKYCTTVNHVRYILLLRNSLVESDDLLQKMAIIRQNLHNKEIMGQVFYRQDNPYSLSLGRKNYKVSIIIPAQDIHKLKTCISSIIRNTNYPHYEIIVVFSSRISDELSLFSDLSHLIIINQESELNFNYSNLCNKGAEVASGEILLFIKETVKFVENTWLQEIITCFAFNSIGAVSPKILREDNTIQYAGIISGGFGFFPIPFNGEANVRKAGINDYAFLNREVSVLSSTCLAIRKEVFEKISGFNEIETPDKFSNADLSFKIGNLGLNCFYCAESTIFTCDSDWYDSWFDKDNEGAYLHIMRNYFDKLEYDPYFTDTMKYCFLKNIPYEYAFYCGKSAPTHVRMDKGKAILLVSHELSLTGAPIALHYAAKAILCTGNYPVVVSPYDGNLRSELTQDGINVIIDNTINGSDFWVKWARNFDMVIVSTLVQYQSIMQLNNCDIPVVWWVHESKESYVRGADKLIPNEIGKNIHVYCGGGYARKTMKTYRPTYNAEELLYCVPDYASEISSEYSYRLENIKDKIVFITVGTIEKRKGQDIFAKAILALPEGYVSMCRFFIIGRRIDDNIYKEVINAKELYPEEVTLINEVSRKEIRDVYSQSDVIVCASRDDPMPVFMTECLMLSKVALCSENTGTASLLQDGVNGFIYADDSWEKLRDKMMFIIDNYDALHTIGAEGRKIYEQYFTEETFNDKMAKVIYKLLN